ncbi:MAG: response regulator transcription factor [Chitinophagaceae bacterium]|nr:response regulator transcription factor [Chitinophagaceae bacterium]
MKVLIVEDDSTLSKNIARALTAEGIATEAVFDGLLAERILKKEYFDCVVMDVNLPGKTGFDVCRDFRNFNAATPVLMLTAFSELDDKVKGYDCGADDYLTKPFYMRELILRINSLIKRNKTQNIAARGNDTITVDDIIIQPGIKKVFRQGSEISLTRREYQVLMKLCEHKGEVVSKNDLVKEIWGTSFDANTNTIEVYVNFLRNKLDKPFGKNTIRTRIGYGYYLETE